MVLDTVLILMLVGTEDMVGSRYRLLAIRHLHYKGDIGIVHIGQIMWELRISFFYFNRTSLYPTFTLM